MASIRRALLSVSDKRGIVRFAAQLHARGIELLSTGGTAALLREERLPVREVADYTGFPELMDGRLKTLHPRVHGGLLGRRGIDDAVMSEHGILPIDLLVVNLYPFAATIARADLSYREAIENIDVGGPAMLRAAAKNHVDVTVLVDPADYQRVLAELDASGETSIDTRAWLAAKAFAHTARYDALIAEFLRTRDSDVDTQLPEQLMLCYDRQIELRYGENPHQRAASYRAAGAARGSGVLAGQVLQGKELSFNNLVDADTAIECVRQFAEPCCVIVKHANPCGVARGTDLLDAYRRAYRADPTSAYGGIIAVNRTLDSATARAILANQFAEVLCAPQIDTAALELLAGKPALRVLRLGELAAEGDEEPELRSVGGGLLLQQRDGARLDPTELRIVTRRKPEEHELTDLLFAWQVARFVKSNAIVLASDGATLGIGAGQMSRLYATRLAIMKAADENLPTRGAVMASDAFLPFRDNLDAAGAAGVAAVIQPGGSRRDAELIEVADEHGMAMVLTGIRHFRH